MEPLTPTTELEAVNTMLGAIGEAPVSSIESPENPDVQIALSILRDTTRSVQTEGWQFNTEFGLEIPPVATLDWEDTGGKTTRLNVFTPPEGLIRFSLTQTTAQIGMSVTIRPSKVYQGGGVKVFYDRILNRDGFDAERFPSLYIDAVFLFGFDDLPESARNYIVHLAARRFAESVVGSETLSRFTTDDLIRARRDLENDQGEEDDYNILDTLDVRRKLGGRPIYYGGFVTDRNSPTHL